MVVGQYQDGRIGKVIGAGEGTKRLEDRASTTSSGSDRSERRPSVSGEDPMVTILAALSNLLNDPSRLLSLD